MTPEHLPLHKWVVSDFWPQNTLSFVFVSKGAIKASDEWI